MKRILYALALTAMSFGVAHAADCKNEIKTIQPGKLVVAGYDYPPFSQTTTDGKLSGIDFDIVKRAAADNCLEVVAMAMDPAGAVQAVVSGKADVAIGSWYRTEKRAAALGMSYPTYLDPMGIYSKDGQDTIESFVGKKVGTVAGYLWVAEMQKFLGPDLKLYQTPLAMAQDLEAGRIDVAADGYNSGVFIQKTQGGYKGIQIKLAKPDERMSSSLTPPQCNVLYTKDNASLGEALDASIKTQHEDGTIAKLLEAVGFAKEVGDTGEPRLIK